MASVRFDRVTKTYPGGVTAVREASLEIRDRELMVLVGPSGCGKSTMLRMIAGLEEVTAGDLFIGDRRVNDVAPKDRDIAMVFQSYALYPHMSVRENMGFGLKLRKLPKDEIRARVEEAARLLGLAEYLERRPKALSGGQRQRVALGRAIVRHPSVFLFDEPLSNLDAALRVQMRSEINALHRRLDATMVYVTHDQVEAMTMADRIAVVKDGVLHQVAEPLTLYNRPVNRFVASFIGSPSMNFLDGAVEGAVFRGAGIEIPLTDGLGAASGHAGRVTLGIRPEDLELLGEESAESGGAGTLLLEATLVEPMGHEIFLHGRVAEAGVLARLGPERLPEAGRRYRLRMKPGQAHLFDAEGRSLLFGADRAA